MAKEVKFVLDKPMPEEVEDYIVKFYVQFCANKLFEMYGEENCRRAFREAREKK